MPSIIDQGITIAGESVLIDTVGDLQEWLDIYLSERDLFHCRAMRAGDSQRFVESNQFRSAYPKLPMVSVGELQWPSGVSRYARALYAVDPWSMIKIAEKAWGFTVPLDENENPILPTTAPADWGYEGNAVELRLDFDELVTAQMYVLPPVRVSNDAFDLWLVPLVDERYWWTQLFSEFEEGSWANLFSGIASGLGIPTISSPAIASDFGRPDHSAFAAKSNLSNILDCAALSVGLRSVRDLDGSVRLQTFSDATMRRTARLAKPIDMGGDSGEAAKPSTAMFSTRKLRDLYTPGDRRHEFDVLMNSGATGNIAINSWCNVHYKSGSVVAGTQTAFQAFANALTAKLIEWQQDEYTFAYSGIVDIKPCGFDDYISWEAKPGCVMTRTVSLPITWAPENVIAQENPNYAIDEQVTYATLIDYIDPSGTATAYLRGISNSLALVTLTAPGTLASRIDAGTNVVVYYEEAADQWRMITDAGGVGGTALRVVRFVLTANATFTAGESIAATVTATSDGSSSGATIAVLASWPIRAKSGAIGTAIRTTAGVYWIIDIQLPQIITGTLNADPTGAHQTPVALNISNEFDHAFSTGIISVENPSGLLYGAWEGSFCEARFNPVINKYELIAVQRFATRLVATMGYITDTIDVVSGIDGPLPPAMSVGTTLLLSNKITMFTCAPTDPEEVGMLVKVELMETEVEVDIEEVPTMVPARVWDIYAHTKLRLVQDVTDSGTALVKTVIDGFTGCNDPSNIVTTGPCTPGGGGG